MTSAALAFGLNLVWSILRMTKARKVCIFAAICFNQTGAQYSRVGRISVLYTVESVVRDTPRLLVQWTRSSLHLFLQRATTSSGWSLKVQALSTIKPNNLVLRLTLHASFPSVKVEVVSQSEFMCITSVLDPFIGIPNVLHHFSTMLRFHCKIRWWRALSTGAHRSIWESSAYLNLWYL